MYPLHPLFYVGLVCVWRTDYGMLGIEDYLVGVWVCYVKYACGEVLLLDSTVCLVVLPNEGLVETLSV